MNDQDMMTAIIASIQTQSNLLLLLQAMIANNVPIQTTTKLQMMCAILGIDTSGAP